MENEGNKNPTAPQAVTPPTAQVSQNPATSLFSKIPHPKIILPVILLVIIGFITLGLFIAVRNNQLKQSQIQVYIQMQKGNFTAAGNLAKQGLVKNPNNPYLLQSVINANSSQGNQTGTETNSLDASKPYINQVLQVDGRSADTLIAIGYAYETAGNYTTALDYYNKAIAADPNSSAAYFHKGHTLAFLNRSVESQAAYDKSYALNPNNPLTLLVKGNEFQGLGEYQKALDSFKKVAENTQVPSSVRAEAYTAAALLSSSQGNDKLSFQNAKQAVELNTNYSPATGIYGYNMALFENPKKGAGIISNGMNQNPRDSFNYVLMGIILRGIGMNDYALAVQKKGLELVPNDNTLVGKVQKDKQASLFLYEIAQTYSQSNQAQSSLQYLKQAFSENSQLRDRLKSDISRGYFQNIKNSSEVLTLLNS